MNPRILELAKQAGLKAESETALSPVEQKFSELIVRECLEVVEKQFGGGDGDGIEWDRAITFTYEDIERYFGVEE